MSSPPLCKVMFPSVSFSKSFAVSHPSSHPCVPSLVSSANSGGSSTLCQALCLVRETKSPSGGEASGGVCEGGCWCDPSWDRGAMPGTGGTLRMWAPAQRQLLTWSDIIS